MTKRAGAGVSALVLAAGSSSRFLGTKQLAKVGGKTLIEAVLDSVPAADVRETVVVLGHDAEAVGRAIGEKRQVQLVVNEAYRAGMGGSIKVGMRALAKDAAGVMLLLGDQPFVGRPLLRRMLRKFEAEGPRARIVAAAYGGLVGPPVVFSSEYFGELVKLRGDHGARSVVQRHAKETSLVVVRSRKAMTDVDTRSDLLAARRLLES